MYRYNFVIQHLQRELLNSKQQDDALANENNLNLHIKYEKTKKKEICITRNFISNSILTSIFSHKNWYTLQWHSFNSKRGFFDTLWFAYEDDVCKEGYLLDPMMFESDAEPNSVSYSTCVIRIIARERCWAFSRRNVGSKLIRKSSSASIPLLLVLVPTLVLQDTGRDLLAICDGLGKMTVCDTVWFGWSSRGGLNWTGGCGCNGTKDRSGGGGGGGGWYFSSNSCTSFSESAVQGSPIGCGRIGW